MKTRTSINNIFVHYKVREALPPKPNEIHSADLILWKVQEAWDNQKRKQNEFTIVVNDYELLVVYTDYIKANKLYPIEYPIKEVYTVIFAEDR